MKYNSNWILHLSISYFILFFVTFQIDAQSIVRESIASTSSSSMVEGVKIQQTIGQPYSTSAYYGSEMGVRPGFQQPMSISVVPVVPALNLKMEVYPNPTTSSFTIRSEDMISVVGIKVTDVNGHETYQKDITELKSHSVNCENWHNGLYIITLYDKHKNNYSYKLIINK